MIATTPETRALLALVDHIPWSQGSESDRMMIRLRSTRTHAEMVAAAGWDTSDPATCWNHGRAIEAAESDPHGFWEQDWPLTQPRRDGWMEGRTVEEWAAHEAGQFPAGFLPVRAAHCDLDPDLLAELTAEMRGGSIEAVRDAAARVEVAAESLAEAKAHRDRAVRAALAAGVGATVVAEATGLNRSRIYQLRGA